MRAAACSDLTFLTDLRRVIDFSACSVFYWLLGLSDSLRVSYIPGWRSQVWDSDSIAHLAWGEGWLGQVLVGRVARGCCRVWVRGNMQGFSRDISLCHFVDRALATFLEFSGGFRELHFSPPHWLPALSISGQFPTSEALSPSPHDMLVLSGPHPLPKPESSRVSHVAEGAHKRGREEGNASGYVSEMSVFPLWCQAFRGRTWVSPACSQGLGQSKTKAQSAKATCSGSHST